VTGTLNGRAQVMGGEITSSGGSFPQNEEYNPTTNTWSTLTAMPTPRHGAAAATIDGVVYVAGGGTTGGSSFSAVHEAFSFGTSSSPTDTTAPTVTSTAPANGATRVALATNVSATFSEAMDGATLNTSTFTLVRQDTTTVVAAALTYDATTKKAVLDPNANLAEGATYIATVKGGTNGAKDLAGNALTVDKVWSFTTEPVAEPVDAPSNLSATRSGRGTRTYIDLRWSDNSQVEAKYVIERSRNSSFTDNLVMYEVAANATSYRDTALQASTTYYYRVVAVRSDGTRSAPSNVATATTKK
jgi:hypothetical protein